MARFNTFIKIVSVRDNFYSLMLMLYITETIESQKDYDAISEAINIAQEYANGGLQFLETDIYTEMDNFTNKLSSTILKFNINNFSDTLNDFGIE